ncbi:MAG: nucleotidyltransferase family protein [marine benthic group bacterium]|nr:nucleotidyltransferase family protein [Gemmatimonadota bacterium]
MARSNPSEPEELLLSLVRRDAATAVSSDRLSRLTDTGFRSAFHSVMAGHGVIGLALTALRRCEAFGGVDHETRERVTAPLRPFAFQAALWDAERDRLLDALRTHSLVPVVLKGGALRLTVYSEPAERLSGDLDLLVPAHRVRDGLEALAAAGYVDHWTDYARKEHVRHGYHLSLSHRNGFEVELHWDLAPRGEGFRFDPAAFLNRSVLYPREGAPPVRVPSPEHMVLHLADQVREDSFSKLKRLVDIDRVVAIAEDSGHDMDWGYLARQARQGGHQAVVGLALQLSRRLLDTPVPAEAVRSLEVDPLVRTHISMLRPEAFILTQQAFRSTVARRALHLWLQPGWGTRVRWARRIIGGSANPMAHVYSARRGVVISQTILARTRRVFSLVKVGAYHGLLHLATLRGVTSGTSAKRSSFWPDRQPRVRTTSNFKRLTKGIPWTSPANTTS